MSSQTQRETLLAYLATVLQPIPNAAVYRSREAALALSEGVAVLIRPAEELVDNRNARLAYRRFLVTVSVIARGLIPDQVADPILLAVQAAVMADNTLGGNCARVLEKETKWDFEVADQNAVAAVISYEIVYATPASSLASQAPFQP